jgi:hypothetical protein
MRAFPMVGSTGRVARHLPSEVRCSSGWIAPERGKGGREGKREAKREGASKDEE